MRALLGARDPVLLFLRVRAEVPLHSVRTARTVRTLRRLRKLHRVRHNRQV